MRARSSLLLVLGGLTLGAWALLGCSRAPSATSVGEASGSGAATEAEVVTPPFEVSGDADGLLLVWFDEEGAHTASRRAEVPAERRGEVRVDSLALDPEARDPEHVFVADLRAEDSHGRYVVRRMPREAFDARVAAHVAEARGEVGGGTGPADASADVVIFGASWCGACREAEAFLRARNIPFVHRDIERDPGAHEDMMRRAAAAGRHPTGIPVIDFRGQILEGFSRDALERAIRETAPAGSAPGVSL